MELVGQEDPFAPQEGFELAITLSRRGVKYTQPDTDVLKKLRPEYADSASSLTAASQVVAINFQTIAAANGADCVLQPMAFATSTIAARSIHGIMTKRITCGAR